MILNRLVVPQGNKLTFYLKHMENGEPYQLASGETYRMTIAQWQEPFRVIINFVTTDNYFDFPMDSFDEGRYVFEIALRDSNGNDRIILPAMDERHQPLNELILLRRIQET